MDWTTYQAGYISEGLRNRIPKSSDYHTINHLITHLSYFGVGNAMLTNIPNFENIDPVLATLHNQLIRGKPTIPSVYIENFLAQVLPFTQRRDDERSGKIAFPLGKDFQEEVLRKLPYLLAPVDPHFALSDYNIEGLDNQSPGERKFIHLLFKTDADVLTQLLEPQTYVNKILHTERNLFPEQKVDFAFINLIGCKNSEEPYEKGLIIEIDGSQHYDIIGKLIELGAKK